MLPVPPRKPRRLAGPIQSALVAGCLAAVAAAHGIATCAACVTRSNSGEAIGLGTRGDRPEIVINLDASRAQGMVANAQLLSIGTVVSETHECRGRTNGLT